MSTRETYSSGLGAAVVIAALGVAGASAPALGVPVAFENPAGPGHFVWNATAGHEFLKITADAASQPGVSGAVGTFTRLESTSPFVNSTIRGATLSSRLQLVNRNVGPTSAALLVGVSAGTLIPTPTGPDLTGFGVAASILFGSSDPGFPQTELPEGAQAFLGVNFNLGSGVQYGWIGVVRTGNQVDAFAWGYETEVGVPIAAGAGLVPAPGTAMAVVIGALAAGRRRRA